MATGFRFLLWCLFLALGATCFAPNTHFFSANGGDGFFLGGEEMKLVGRSMKMINVDDYSDASANHGHDPRNKFGGGNGHKAHDSP